MLKNVITWVACICLCCWLPAAAQQAVPCKGQARPLVLVHGFLGAGDNFVPMLQQLYAAGYCPQQCFLYDWNSMERVDQSPLLDRFIDSVLQLTGTAQVDLIGHSAGGGVSGAYCADSVRMQKVNRYVHIGSSLLKGPVGKDGSIPTLNIYSTADRVVKGGSFPGATNIAFTAYDHFEIVTADSVVQAIYRFLNPGKNWQTTPPKNVPGTFEMRGKVLTLGQNVPRPGSKIVVYALDAGGKPATRATDSTVADAAGRFTLRHIRPETPYLVQCFPPTGRAMAYYFRRFAGSSTPVYLRTLPADGMVAALLGNLPAHADKAVLVLFSNKSAVISGRNRLLVNGLDLATPAMADASKTAVAWFMYDGNNNSQSELTLQNPLSNFPFMRAVDIALETAKGTVQIEFNTHILQVPILPAAQFITIVVPE